MNRCRLGSLLGLAILALAGCRGGAPARTQSGLPVMRLTSTATATAFAWFPPTPTPPRGASAPPQAAPDMKPGVGNVLLTDDLTAEGDWKAEVSDQAVVVTSKGLTVAAQPGTDPVAAFRRDEIFKNVYAEITARPSLCRDQDDYGLLFRAPNRIAFYRFALACNGTEGATRVSLGATRILQPPILSADAPVGAPGEVRLGVWAVGSEFRFFLNGRYQFTANDSSYAAGQIGVFAYAAGETPVAVTFSDLVVHAVADAVAP